jgi:GMP synthase-like glutamine amidotransferase
VLFQRLNCIIKPSNDFFVLAKSQKCVQAIQHKIKPLFGVMFHPEVRNPEIIEKFLNLKELK